MVSSQEYPCLDVQEMAHSSFKDHPLLNLKKLNLFHDYLANSYRHKWVDQTFVVIYHHQPVALVPCHVIENKLCYDNTYITILYFTEPTESLIKVIISRLKEISIKHQCTSIILQDQHLNGDLSFLGKELFNLHADHQIQFDMQISFKNFNEAEYFSDLRKRYKPMINWGRNNFKIEYVNDSNYSFEEFLLQDKLFRSLNGIELRPRKSLEYMGELVKNGYGEMAHYFYNGDLIASCLFIDEPLNTQYYTGVYNKKFENKGVAHFPIFNGIVRSAERNKESYCSLGFISTNISKPKWATIQHFKKGFCEALRPSLLWKIQENEKAKED